MTVNDPSTPETAPGGPQERPEGGSATPAPPESLSGPQKGAESLRLWDRMLQAVRDTPAGYPDDIAAAVWLVVQTELAGHYQHAVDTAVAAEQRATQAETKLHRYRDWLATQHANAARADQAGGVPDHLKISPHNGIAAGLHTALLGLDRLLNPHDADPTVREAAAQDRAYWERKDAGEQP